MNFDEWWEKYSITGPISRRGIDACRDAFNAGVSTERERCLKITDKSYILPIVGTFKSEGANVDCHYLAEQIRKGGE